VQLEEFDKRLVDYGLLISTAHYSGRCCDKEKKWDSLRHKRDTAGSEWRQSTTKLWDSGTKEWKYWWGVRRRTYGI